VELEGDPGDRWGVAKLAANPVEKGQRVNIIQHPAGLPKQVSFQNNFVEYSDHQVVQYLTSTLRGSSGSPVFNDEWEVVALHHAGGLIVEPNSKRTFLRNEGIAIAAVLSDLPPEARWALSLAN
jgi:V8-like Glu-specific endopeptidase